MLAAVLLMPGATAIDLPRNAGDVCKKCLSDVRISYGNLCERFGERLFMPMIYLKILKIARILLEMME